MAGRREGKEGRGLRRDAESDRRWRTLGNGRSSKRRRVRRTEAGLLLNKD